MTDKFTGLGVHSHLVALKDPVAEGRLMIGPRYLTRDQKGFHGVVIESMTGRIKVDHSALRSVLIRVFRLSHEPTFIEG